MKVAIAHHCSPTPMGQELADAALIAGLAAVESEIHAVDLSMAALRARVPAVRRLPLAQLAAAPWGLQRAVGRMVYQGNELVHRLDLRLPPAPGREIITVRDLAPIRFRDEGRMPRTAPRSIRSARAVICPSRFTAEEVRRTYGREDVNVIADGIDPAFLKGRPLSEDERRLLGLPERFVVHSGGATIRKNLAGLARAWPTVRARHPDVALVLCGPPDDRRHRLFESLDGTQLMGHVPRTQLVDLVTSAAAVVVPSRYEGYGLPAQEAMAAGVPLVATAAGSLPEVASVGAILVEDDPRALADGLTRALDGVSQADLAAAAACARARTWERAAQAHLEVYRRVAGDGPSRTLGRYG